MHSKLDEYKQFLKDKIVLSHGNGLDIKVDLIKFKDGTQLKPHQRDAINWAIAGGQRAIFASFGLGKSIMQLIVLNEIIKEIGGKALIVCPLGVKQEFKRDAFEKLGIEIEYVTSMQECIDSDCSILITNYERVRDGNIDPNFFNVTSLDEASVLRSYGSKTYQEFLPLFSKVKYKFVATATPSPNRYKELIHYAGYLGVMDTGEALTRFFKRDSTKANNLTLYPHKEKEFWLWVSSWALFITKPSDLGYDDTGYDLPELIVNWHEVSVDHLQAGFEGNGQGKLFRSAALSLKDSSREKRESIDNRIQKLIEIVESDKDSHFIFWHDLEAERKAIKKAIPESFEVYGSQDLDVRESRTLDFENGYIKYFASKPRISGSGCNFQRHCHRAIFLGVNYKFNDFIQSIHRIYRFLQENQVIIDIIYAESEQEIVKVLKDKWIRYNELVKKMTDIIKENGLSIINMETKLERFIAMERIEKKGKFYTAVNSDCVFEMFNVPDNHAGMILTSIPFANHYEYTPTYNDMGHTKSNEHFFQQMDFLTPELFRVLQPGRILAVHVKDRVLFGNVTGFGFPTLDFFHMETAFHFMKHGFKPVTKITIETDVVRENNQTYRLGWTEQCKDGSKMGTGCPEYILVFRKPQTDLTRGYADIPVIKEKSEYKRGRWQIDARAKWNSSGNRLLRPDEMKQLPIDVINQWYSSFVKDKVYDYDEHVRIATELEDADKLPATFETLKVPARGEYVWGDINRMLTLNTSQSKKNKEMHICPLQIDVVERLITRYSNEGDLILDPFGGLMTVPYIAIKLGRKGYGIELNHTSFLDGLNYLMAMEQKVQSPTLLDLIELEENKQEIES